jgi:hypothetical protein
MMRRRECSALLGDELERVGTALAPQSHFAQPRRPPGLFFVVKESPGRAGASSCVTKEKA